jgi:hypothetical protein
VPCWVTDAWHAPAGVPIVPSCTSSSSIVHQLHALSLSRSIDRGRRRQGAAGPAIGVYKSEAQSLHLKNFKTTHALPAFKTTASYSLLEAAISSYLSLP